MSNDNTESNNSNSQEPQQFGESIPTDPDRQSELVEDSMQEYLQMQRHLEQEAEEYLSRSVHQDYAEMHHVEE